MLITIVSPNYSPSLLKMPKQAQRLHKVKSVLKVTKRPVYLGTNYMYVRAYKYGQAEQIWKQVSEK